MDGLHVFHLEGHYGQMKCDHLLYLLWMTGFDTLAKWRAKRTEVSEQCQGVSSL
jgi:hypothetical protein